MTIVLPHGVLFRGGEEGVIREKLIEANHIDAIIGLPASIFFGTGIPTIVIVLKQKRDNTDVLIVDASKGFIKAGKNNKLRASDIKRIADTVIGREIRPKYSKLVSRDEIRKNEYNLNIPRYVDSSENPESWNIYASMFGGIPEKEIDELERYWEAFPGLREFLFSKSSSAYADLKVEDIRSTIQEHLNVKEFVENFKTSFGNFDSFLKNELFTNMMTVKISKEETVLSDDIFRRLEFVPLIDKYEAYQLLDDDWDKIKVDLEIIQTEGFEATGKVDPNMVIKKKEGKEQEVQEGWSGRIMPFELVQETYLQNDLQKLKLKEKRLTDITSEYEQILESLSEEEKDADTVSEAKDSFVNAEVTKEAKQLKIDAKKTSVYPEDSYETKILKVAELIEEEKELKKQVKSEAEKLHLKTKDTIEKLSEKQVYELLELKWISPLVTSLNQLPEVVISELTTKVQALSEKYITTYSHVMEEIHESEKVLSSLIDELEGNEFDMAGLIEFKDLLRAE